MAEFAFLGKSLKLPAIAIRPRCKTSSMDAWAAGNYITVLLQQPVNGLRVHTKGRTYPDREASGEAGAWVLLGDVILSSSGLAQTRSLPTYDPGSATAFTHVSEARMAVGTYLNIGLASALFAGAGGGFQGEFVRGPAIQFKPLTGKVWMNRAGLA